MLRTVLCNCIHQLDLKAVGYEHVYVPPDSEASAGCPLRVMLPSCTHRISLIAHATVARLTGFQQKR